MVDLTGRRIIASSVLLALSAIATYYMRLNTGASAAVGPYFETIFKEDRFQFPDSDITLRRVYTGIPQLDAGLSFLVTAFMPGASGLNRTFQLQQALFLFSFVPVIAIFSIEAGRRRNAGNLLIYTSAWSLLYQTVGGAIIIPLWFLFFALKASGPDYYKQSPAMDATKAKALLAALLVGYVVPTVYAFQPYQTLETQQLMVAIWQPCPLYVNLIWWALSRGSGAQQADKAKASAADMPHLRIVYLTSIVTATLAYMAVVWLTITSALPDVSLWHVFMPTEQIAWTMSEALLFIFQVDYWIIFVAALFTGYFALWDMRVSQVMQGGLGVIAGTLPLFTVLFGPGAVVGIMWYLREEAMRDDGTKES